MFEEPILRPENIKIKQLVSDYGIGRIVIPEFQRQYVWKPAKAPRLVDSIYRNFPIASLLLWQSTEQIHARAPKNRVTYNSSTNWLIDGQQRVITLARMLGGEDGLDVVFNPKTDAFSLQSAATRKDPDWYPLSAIFDDDTYRDLRRDLGEGSVAKQSEARFEKVRKVLDYEVPIIRMINHTFQNAVSAFERINTMGVRLKREDIDSARIAAQHSGFIANDVVPYLETLRSQKFNRLNIMHLFRACASIALPDGRNRTPLQALSQKEIMSAWKLTKKGTDQTVRLVRSELGLVNMDILWSGALLVPLIVLCARMEVKELDVPGLIGWLALATLFHRYSSSTETALDQDIRACGKDDPIGALLANLRAIRSPLLAEAKDFNGQIADKSALLAMYIACKHRGILDFLGGGTIVMQGAVDRHHILPKGQFPKKDRAAADNIANIAFISGSANKSINMAGPEVYLKSLKPGILKSQCVPEDKGLWFVERAEAFWDSRRDLLADAFNEFVKKSLPDRRGVGG